jgi:hypothetical protein
MTTVFDLQLRTRHCTPNKSLSLDIGLVAFSVTGLQTKRFSSFGPHKLLSSLTMLSTLNEEQSSVKCRAYVTYLRCLTIGGTIFHIHFSTKRGLFETFTCAKCCTQRNHLPSITAISIPSFVLKNMKKKNEMVLNPGRKVTNEIFLTPHANT